MADINTAIEVISSLAYEVRRLAAAHPKARYEQGSGGECGYTLGYVYEQEQQIGYGCLVGMAVRQPDLPDELIQFSPGHELALGDELDGAIDEVLADSFGVNEMDEEAPVTLRALLVWLGKVQAEQDNERSWGECVRLADQATIAYLEGWAPELIDRANV